MQQKITRYAMSHPVSAAIALLIAALLFRLIDIFLLRLDERLGEIILSKAIGFGLVVLFLYLIGRSLRDIGFTERHFDTALLVGVLLTLFLFCLAYLVEWLLYAPVRISFAAIDPKAGVEGGLVFGGFLILGNIVNAFMEEGLFRGVMLPLFGIRYRAAKAILLQAFLFGLWHLPWALKAYTTGAAATPIEIMGSAFQNFAPQFLMGVVFGVMFHYTRSIWTPVLSHFFINSVLNLIHTRYAAGLDQGMTVRMGVFILLFLLCIPLIVRYARRKINTPPLIFQKP